MRDGSGERGESITYLVEAARPLLLCGIQDCRISPNPQLLAQTCRTPQYTTLNTNHQNKQYINSTNIWNILTANSTFRWNINM